MTRTVKSADIYKSYLMLTDSNGIIRLDIILNGDREFRERVDSTFKLLSKIEKKFDGDIMEALYYSNYIMEVLEEVQLCIDEFSIHLNPKGIVIYTTKPDGTFITISIHYDRKIYITYVGKDKHLPITFNCELEDIYYRLFECK